MKVIYIYNDDLTFSHSAVLDDNQDMPDNATLVAPSGLFDPFTYDKNQDKWFGISEDEWNKSHKSTIGEPTKQDQINATLIKQNLQLTKDMQALKEANSNG